MMVFFLAVLLSECVNFRSIESTGVTIYMIKGLSFFASFFVVYFIVVSVTATRPTLDLFVRVLVVGGAIVGATCMVEYRTGYNVFNHLSSIFPLLRFEGPLTDISRSSRLRVYASSQHPIALAAVLVMMLPLGLYLAQSTRRARWWIATFLLGVGSMATLSRTAITMIAAAAFVLWRLRPIEFKRLLPLLVPAFLVVFLALPQALGTFKSTFFPQGGLIADQTGTGAAGNGYKSGRLATLGPGLHTWSERPFFGQGYSTRVIDPTDPRFVNSNILDDQWLGVLIDTGAAGFGALVWVFIRSTRLLRRVARDPDAKDGFLAGALAASVVSYGVGMITYDAFSFIQVTFMFFIVLALSSSLLIIAKKERAERRLRPDGSARLTAVA
jgi:hypothetical protein